VIECLRCKAASCRGVRFVTGLRRARDIASRWPNNYSEARNACAHLAHHEVGRNCVVPVQTGVRALPEWWAFSLVARWAINRRSAGPYGVHAPRWRAGPGGTSGANIVVAGGVLGKARPIRCFFFFFFFFFFFRVSLRADNPQPRAEPQTAESI